MALDQRRRICRCVYQQHSLAVSWRQDVALWSAGDFTPDGNVNSANLNGLALNWQESIPSAASPESVPERSGIAILLVGAFLARGVKKLYRAVRVFQFRAYVLDFKARLLYAR